MGHDDACYDRDETSEESAGAGGMQWKELTFQYSSSDGDIAGEGALLVDVAIYNGVLGGLEA